MFNYSLGLYGTTEHTETAKETPDAKLSRERDEQANVKWKLIGEIEIELAKAICFDRYFTSDTHPYLIRTYVDHRLP